METARASGTLDSIRAMLLVDMVGDRNLNIRREANSTRWLTDIVWAAASRLGHGDVFLDEPLAVEDDHAPFLAAGVPAVDIIDLDYPAWHTPNDTLDNVSARSLQTVGDVLLAALPADRGGAGKTVGSGLRAPAYKACRSYPVGPKARLGPRLEPWSLKPGAGLESGAWSLEPGAPATTLEASPRSPPVSPPP